MSAVSTRIDLFDHESRELVDFLGTLPPEAWAVPSACEGWTVADVIGHLRW